MAFSTVFSDDFAGAAGTTLAGRAGWTEVRISGNGKQAQLDGSGHAGSPWYPSQSVWTNRPLVVISAAIAAKQRVTTTIAATTLGSNGGILLTWDTAADNGYRVWWKFGSSKLAVSRIDAGVDTEIASGVVAATDVTVDVTKVRAAIDPATNTITVEVDRTGAGVWATEITVVDSTYSGGTVGLVFHTTAAQFADFLAEDEAAGGSGDSGTGTMLLGAPAAAVSGLLRTSGVMLAGTAAPALAASGLLRLAGNAAAAFARIRMGGVASLRLVAVGAARMAPAAATIVSGPLRLVGIAAGRLARLAASGGEVASTVATRRRLRVPPPERRFVPGTSLRKLRVSALRRLLRP